MSDDKYHIPMKHGYSKKLRFHFAPVSEAIMNADADWLFKAEISCDLVRTKAFVYPIMRKYLPEEFQWQDELNLMPFENAHNFAWQLRKLSKLLMNNYYDPRLNSYKRLYSVDLLVSDEEYEELYAGASDLVKRQGVEENIDVVIEFYMRLSKWIEDTIDEYEPKGCNAFAIFAPH